MTTAALPVVMGSLRERIAQEKMGAIPVAISCVTHDPNVTA